jgi:2-polyprenyl-3-methyl-5-hydroxy-6-metoxy-1,4-benzoquinol methylase
MDPRVYSTYFELEKHNWWFVARRKIIAQVLRDSIAQKVERACDIGCGAGVNFPILSQAARQVGGLEMSEEAVMLARGSYPDADIVTGVFPSTPIPQCDLVTMFDVLEHFDDDVAALKEIRARLTQNGILVLTVPAHQYLWSSHDDIVHHQRRYSRHSLLRSLRSAGFTPVRITYFNALLFVPILAYRVLRKLFGDNRSSDLFTVPKPLNILLEKTFSLERLPLRFMNLPIGVSFLCVARKSAEPAGPR